jgi:hypothetical protein
MIRKIVCPCERSFEAEMPVEADLDAETGLEDRILSGDFLSVPCPGCGTVLKPEFPCRVRSLARKFDVLLLPEMERTAYLCGRYPMPKDPPLRVAVGFAELAEKLRILREGMDDRAVEAVKYHLLSRIPDNQDQGEDPDILFHGVEEGKLVFYIRGIREGEVGVSRIARNAYQKLADRMTEAAEEEPYVSFCQPPYVSIHRITRD